MLIPFEHIIDTFLALSGLNMASLKPVSSPSKLRFAILTLVSLSVLASCGGGGGSSDAHVPTITEDDLEGTKLVYSGSREPASISPVQGWEFVEFAMTHLHSGSDIDDSCTDGGEIKYEGELSQDGTGNLLVIYDNCTTDQVSVNGNAMLKVVTYMREQQLIFNELRITGPDNLDLIYSGKIIANFNGSCSQANKQTHDIILEDQNTGEQVLAENVIETIESPCYKPSYTLDGRIYNSRIGYVDLTTIQKLEYHSRNSDSPIGSGELRILGNAFSSATLGFETLSYFNGQGSTQETRAIMSWSIDSDGNGEVDAISRLYSDDSLYEGIFSDMHDDDNDGMHNSWEIYYGLDVNRPDDAGEDSDQDGTSNIEEYTFYGQPIDASIEALVSDPYVDIGNIRGDVRAGQFFGVTVSIKNNTNITMRDNIKLTVQAPVEARMNSIPYYCEASSEREFVCDIDSYTIRYHGGSFFFVFDDAGDYGFSASITPSGYDKELSNNSASRTFSIGQRESDLTVTDQRADITALTIGVEKYLTYTLRRVSGDDVLYAQLEFDIPETIDVSDVYVFMDNIAQGRELCSQEKPIVCDVGKVGSLSVKIALVATEQEYNSISASISSEAIETDDSNNSVTTNVVAGLSYAPIEALIRNAADNDVIIVPDGWYVGNPVIRKPVRLVSENGPSSSVLWFDATPFNYQDYATIYYNFPISIEGFTLKGNTKLNLTANTELIGNIVQLKEIAIWSNQATIKNNLFMCVYAGSFAGLFNSLLTANISEELNVSNNVFRGSWDGSITPECSGLAVNSVPNSSVSRMQIAHNTFYQIQSAVWLPLIEASGSLMLANNLFLENTIAVGTKYGYGGSIQDWFIYNNLLYSNFTNFYDPEYSYLILENNIYTDPMLADPQINNFMLGEFSPAIDAGYIDINLEDDIRYNARPTDGNGDEVPEPDIGAYEFQP